MLQEIVDPAGAVLGQVSGPWWTADTFLDPDSEYAAEETFFRLEFSGPATFRLAANGFYQFWLNGTWMGDGPARASHGRLTVDEWELPATLLREKNTICVQVFWQGIFTFDQVRGTPAFWYSLNVDGNEIPAGLLASTKTGRLAKIKSSLQRGWIEEIDGRGRTAGWPTGPWNPAEWQKPVLRTQDPEIVLEPRDIKSFVRKPLRCKTVSFAGSGDLSRRTKHRGMYFAGLVGFEDSVESPSSTIQEEELEPAEATDLNLSALTDLGEGVAVLGPDARGLDRTVQLHFGQLATGTLRIGVEAPAGTVIDLGWSEGRWNETDMGSWARSGQPGGSAPSQELDDTRQGMRFICAGGGVETFHSLYLVSVQNLRIAFRSPRKGASIRVHDCTLITRGYPVPPEGSFICSDGAINRIHDAILHTLRCSVDDVYVDSPGRERGGSPGDSYFASHGFLEVTGDCAFDRRFLRLVMDSQDAAGLDGTTFPVYPSDSVRWRGWNSERVYFITGHHLFWLLQCERHLRLHGDAALKEKWRTGLALGLGCLDRFRNEEGLIENVPWDTFLDRSQYQGGPLQTGDNFLYALALLRLGELFQDKEWIAQGKETARAIDRFAWHEDRELYADTVVRKDGSLESSRFHSAVTNFLALWTGLADPARAARIWRIMRDFRPVTASRPLFDYETDFVRSNLAGLMYRFGYQGRRGELAELIRDLRDAYEPMFARGQSTAGEHLGYHGSLCHGYNAYVLHLLNRHLAGIELPDKPGGTILFRLQSMPLEWCQARVCWMDGYVQIWWSKVGDELEVIASVPAGQKGELIVGHGNPVRFTNSLHTKVALNSR